MTTQKPHDDEQGRDLELDVETVKDLDVDEADAQNVAGGQSRPTIGTRSTVPG